MGRPAGSPNKYKITGKEMALAVLSKVDQQAIWSKHLQDKDPRVSIEALKYLNDRAWGKPAQMLEGNPNQPITIRITYEERIPRRSQETS